VPGVACFVVRRAAHDLAAPQQAAHPILADSKPTDADARHERLPQRFMALTK
jgi:hypothetical protein